ncbi:MAG: hypothetical protein JO352_04065 [Chloroflexi bacterium]|nr:hypothetical protein [Chloroflexota bacterium]
MYVVVRDYRNEAPGGVQRAIELQGSIKQVLAGVPGLHAYYAVDKGDGSLVTISVYADKSSAEESNRVAASWVRDNMARWAPDPPTLIKGEVVITAP